MVTPSVDRGAYDCRQRPSAHLWGRPSGYERFREHAEKGGWNCPRITRAVMVFSLCAELAVREKSLRMGESVVVALLSLNPTGRLVPLQDIAGK